MLTCALIDYAEDALAMLAAVSGLSVDKQIDRWHAFYRERAPCLLEKVTADYEAGGHDWRAVAREHVWPHLLENLERMEAARCSMLDVCASLYERAAGALGLDFDVLFVVYVGIGSGAGWATRFRGRPAVLVGLENVAELGWQGQESMRGLLAHEIGHLFMFERRGEEPRAFGDPLCDLFEEGFAQHAEHSILAAETWHCSSQEGWLEWCKENEARLARRYLESLQDKGEVRRFFGSWFDIEGWRQTGYFLGCRMMAPLAQRRGMGELALLPCAEMRQLALQYLEFCA